MTQHIRLKMTGEIFDYHPVLAQNPACEVVSEEDAFPERYMPAGTKRRRRTSKLNFTTEDIPEAPPYTSPEINIDASRNLP